MPVEIANLQKTHKINLEKVNKETEKILNALGCDDFLLSLSFVSEDEISRLNKRYLDVDKPTDVLSFPQLDISGTDDITSFVNRKTLEAERAVLGDVVICPNIAEKNTKATGRVFEDEIVHLIIHSTLHLLGYAHDNDRDARRMKLKEKEVFEFIRSKV